jgi:hypothetical protein
MICRSSTTGMSEHPNVTALPQDALRSTSRAEWAVLCLQGPDRRGTKRCKYSDLRWAPGAIAAEMLTHRDVQWAATT